MVASGDDIESMCRIVEGNLKEGTSEVERKEGERELVLHVLRITSKVK